MRDEYEQMPLPLQAEASHDTSHAVELDATPTLEDAAEPLPADTVTDSEKHSVPEDESPQKSARPRRDIPTILFPSRLDPSISLHLKLYQGSGKKQEYRAILNVAGFSEPHKEKYCNSLREAKEWAKTEGEDALFEDMDISHFKMLPEKLRLGTAFHLMKNTPEARSFRDYFQENPLLLRKLSEKPLSALSVEHCSKALQETFEDEGSRAKAVLHLNRLLGLCHARGLRNAPLRLRFNSRKQDVNLHALHRTLRPRILPDDLSRKLYLLSRERMKENPYYLAILLQLTMGLSISEVAALQYRDLCDGTEDIAADDSWVRPKGPVWYFRIRRFSKRVSVPGENGATTKCVVMKTENIFKYRLVVIPIQAKEVLEEYLDRYSNNVLGKTPLISGRKEGSGITADAVRMFTKKVLAGHGVKQLERWIFLPSIDGLRKDAHERLAPRLTIFQSTLEYQMNRYGFGPHEIRAFLGRSPITVLDAHYWESKTRMAQLRQLRKLARWDLLGDTTVPDVPQHQSWHDTCVDAELPSLKGHVVSAAMTISGLPGRSIHSELLVPYGFDCQYVVTHSQPSPENHS